MNPAHPRFASFRVFAFAFLSLCIAAVRAGTPVSGHPRLWITAGDLDRLRGWAAPSNPMWQNALLPALQQAVQTYNTQFFPNGGENPNWPDPGNDGWVTYCTEAYAQFFAFLALVDPDPVARAQHAQRGRNLLMHAIHEAQKGQAPTNPDGSQPPFRSPFLMTYNRANYWGECWGLTIDWLQGAGALSTQDRADIRTVLLRWCGELANAIGNNGCPQPAGVYNSPQLFQNKQQTRYALNNYFTGHMRTLCLLALSLDAADDPPVNPSMPDAALGNSVRSYIADVTGAWLYMQYAMYEDANTVAATLGVSPQGLGLGAGGLSVEGFLYGHSLGYLAHAMLALRTAGYDDPALSGPQIALLHSSYWDKFSDGFLHSITPAPAIDPKQSYLGPLWPFASYGDVLRYWIIPDHGETFAALGIFDMVGGNGARLAKERWIAANTPEGGIGRLVSRAGSIWGNSNASRAILHFLCFDPAAPASSIPDPRPSLPLEFWQPAYGRAIARTDWTAQTRIFDFKCSWTSINHQSSDNGQFEFYRKGQWLTKERSGYPLLDNLGACPKFHNTLSLQNTSSAGPNVDAFATGKMQWYESDLWYRGAQWKEGLNAGDPRSAASFGPGYVACFGDMTNLYNRPSSTPEVDCTDILHASRSLLWLKPDHLVVYDRVTSKTAGRFKRWHLQLTGAPAITGRLATIPLGGQTFYVQSLLPAGGVMTGGPSEDYQSIAEADPVTHELMVEDPSNPADVRFLHVLQGADAGVAQDAPTLLQSSAGAAFEGALVKNTVVLFRKTLSGAAVTTSYSAPAAATQHYVCDLAPNAGYTVTVLLNGASYDITVTPGGSGYFTDQAGVLAFNPTAPPPSYALTVVNGGGSGAYAANQPVTISANAAPAGTAFVNWSGATVADPNAATTTLSMPAADATVTANYGPAYPLTVNGGSGSGSYAAGVNVAIAANPPPPGQIFDLWLGAAVANPASAATTLAMPAAAASVTASYKPAPTVTLTVVNGTGSGSYLAGSTVTITAQVPSGYVFSSWTGATAANPNAAQTTVTLPSQNVTITATFAPSPAPTYALTVHGGSGSGAYIAGAIVPITANPAPAEQTFDRWTGAGVASPGSASTTVVMPAGSLTVAARFKPLVEPQWEFWADTTNGAPRGGRPTIAVSPSHDLYCTVWNVSPNPGAGAVYKAAFASPRSFSLLPQSGFTLSTSVQSNLSMTALDPAGRLVACASSITGSVSDPNVKFLYRFNAASNSWQASALQFSPQQPGDYFYNARMMRCDPASGAFWAVGESASAWKSVDGGATFVAMPQRAKLPSDLRGGGGPIPREFALAIAPPSARHPQGVVYTAGENDGVVCSFDGGATWQSVDPHYRDAVSPLARVHPSYDLAIPGQTTSGTGDCAALGVAADGSVVLQTSWAVGYNGGNGGSDAIRMYRFHTDRPDLPALAARGVPDATFPGGQSPSGGYMVTTASGLMFYETGLMPGNGRGGILTSRDGYHWSALNTGIGYTGGSTSAGQFTSNGLRSLAADGDDVFMMTNAGRMYHYVAPGAFTISGSVRDPGGNPVAGAIVRTQFGNFARTDASGAFTIAGVGRSMYPHTVTVSSAGWAFAPQTLQVDSPVAGIQFSAAPAALASIALSPQQPKIGTGGSVQFSAIGLDQFGQPLASQPSFTWQVDAGGISSDGLFTAPSGAAVTANVTVFSGAVSAATQATSIATAPNVLLASASPATGPITGGTTVTIKGLNFTSSMLVFFGGVPASNVQTVDSSTLTCRTPDLSHSPNYGAPGAVPIIAGPQNSQSPGSVTVGALLRDGFTTTGSATQTYFLNIFAGNSGGQTQLQLPPGATVNLTAAPPPSGQQFYAWTGGAGGSFGDELAANTVFVMPDSDATVIATYRLAPTLPQTASPQATFSGNFATLSCATAGADIYYTLDGTTPSTPGTTPSPNGILYAGPFTAPSGATIRAVATAVDRADSAELSAAAPSPFDQWRQSHFGASFAADPDAAEAADPDGDDIPNLMEYALGLDPWSVSRAGLPGIGAAGPYLTLSFTRIATDVTYIVQVSSDLATWSDGSVYAATGVNAPSTAATTDVTPAGSPPGFTVVRDNTPMSGSSRRFLRLKIARP